MLTSQYFNCLSVVHVCTLGAPVVQSCQGDKLHTKGLVPSEFDKWHGYISFVLGTSGTNSAHELGQNQNYNKLFLNNK